jgi:ribosomal protein L15
MMVEKPQQTPRGTQTDPPVKKDPPADGIPAQEVDYKKKFSESTTENQRILKDNAQLLREKAEAESKLAEAQRTLSEKELKEKYPNWDEMLPEEQVAKKEEIEKEKRLKILEAKEKWREDYARLSKATKEKIENKGGEEAFKDFACSPENRGQKNLANLVKQFLFEEPVEQPTPPEEELKLGLEPGTGGPSTIIPKKEGYTAEQAAEMRVKDPKKYNKLVSEGRMKII